MLNLKSEFNIFYRGIFKKSKTFGNYIVFTLIFFQSKKFFVFLSNLPTIIQLIIHKLRDIAIELNKERKQTNKRAKQTKYLSLFFIDNSISKTQNTLILSFSRVAYKTQKHSCYRIYYYSSLEKLCLAQISIDESA